MTVLLTSIDTGTSEDTQGAWMLGAIVFLYFVRNQSPILRSIWDVFVVIMAIILVICTLGLLRDWAKKFFK
jgi:hypothetical protein